MKRDLVLPMAIILSLAVGVLLLAAQAWNAARLHETARRNSLSTRMQQQELPRAEMLAGLVAVVEGRDVAEAGRLLRQRLLRDIEPSVEDKESYDRLIAGLEDWIDEELDRTRLRSDRIFFLFDLLRECGAEDRQAGFQRQYEVRMAELHRLVDEFDGMTRTLEPYLGMVDDAGALQRVVDSYQEMMAIARDNDFDPLADPRTRATIERARERVWEHAKKLLEPYADALKDVPEEKLEQRLGLIRGFNATLPIHRAQLAKTARTLELLGWSGDDADPQVRLLALATNDVAGGAGLVAVMLSLFLMPLVVLSIALREVAIGPAPVDPSAETLEHVDPIDLDTEGVTLGASYTTHGATSDGHTTGLSSVTGTAVRAGVDEDDTEGVLDLDAELAAVDSTDTEEASAIRRVIGIEPVTGSSVEGDAVTEGIPEDEDT